MDRLTLRLKINDEIDNYIEEIGKLYKDNILKNKAKINAYIGIMYDCLARILDLRPAVNNKELCEYLINELNSVIDQAESIKELEEIRKEKISGQKI